MKFIKYIRSLGWVDFHVACLHKHTHTIDCRWTVSKVYAYMYEKQTMHAPSNKYNYENRIENCGISNATYPWWYPTNVVLYIHIFKQLFILCMCTTVSLHFFSTTIHLMHLFHMQFKLFSFIASSFVIVFVVVMIIITIESIRVFLLCFSSVSLMSQNKIKPQTNQKKKNAICRHKISIRGSEMKRKKWWKLQV